MDTRGGTGATLVATLGPSSANRAVVAALRQAGADGVRLNGSHLDAEELRRLVDTATAAGFESTQVTLDLQGGKTRIRGLAAPVELSAGADVVLTPPLAEAGDSAVPRLPVDRPEFLETLAPPDTIRIDDGRVTLRVVESTESGVKARATGAGRISNRKGLALVGREVRLPPRLLDDDLQLIETALELGVGALAVSYAAVPGILQAAREAAAAGKTGEPAVVAKLEQPEALERVDEILARSDAVWLCRGDLGAEVGLARLPALQRRLLDASLGRTRVLVAGQVLHHMTVSPRPTRSEVCHVGDLLGRGVAGFVLSDETATGPHGPEAVRVLRGLMDEAALASSEEQG